MAKSNAYLAVDIGASSGRHVLGWVEDGCLHTREIHRFPNRAVLKNGHLCWEVDRLFAEIKAGMRKCAAICPPAAMGIDTWAVDFVLLDKQGQHLGDAVSYRDERTAGMPKRVYAKIPEPTLYRRSGIQRADFNTIFQLEAIASHTPSLLEKADRLLMLPDYFHYLLTGIAATEYTNATTTQLVPVGCAEWDHELIGILGYPDHIFGRILTPGTVLGNLLPGIVSEVGFDCPVILPPTHDTASAVAAAPLAGQSDTAFLSSGTWSLMGVERPEADCSETSHRFNFTNEGGYGGTIRYLKNIMGLWMLQELQRELPDAPSFDRLCQMAEASDFDAVVDCQAAPFFAPGHMAEKVQSACREAGQPVPETVGDIAAVLYKSLAACYEKTLMELETSTGRTLTTVNVVGGGAKAEYLNRLLERVSGRSVVAGPAEATAIGNLAVQMIAQGVFADIREARACILKSLDEKRNAQ